MSAPDVILIGGGGHARVVADVLTALGRNIRGFVAPESGRGMQPIAWLGDDPVLDAISPREAELAIGIGSTGDSTLRRTLFDRLTGAGHEFPALVHPSAQLGGDVTLAPGAQVMLGAAVQAHVRIGANAIINTGAVVDHDCEIGAHAHIAPGAVLCGTVTVGEGAHVGAGARVLQTLSIGAGALIGAGAVVLEDVPPGARVAGIPARPIGSRETRA